jgi:hypothetical protein
VDVFFKYTEYFDILVMNDLAFKIKTWLSRRYSIIQIIRWKSRRLEHLPSETLSM